MRNVFRAFLAAAAIAATALAGSASVAAASSDNLPSFSERYEIDDAWCFDYGDVTDCTVQHITAVIQFKSSGDSTLRLSEKQSITTTDNATGLQVGSQKLTSVEKTVFEDGFQSKTWTIRHVRYDGPEGTCISTYQVKVVDFEVQVDRFLGPGCK
jgi:ABC-type transport system substrate-binding protein